MTITSKTQLDPTPYWRLDQRENNWSEFQLTEYARSIQETRAAGIANTASGSFVTPAPADNSYYAVSVGFPVTDMIVFSEDTDDAIAFVGGLQTRTTTPVAAPVMSGGYLLWWTIGQAAAGNHNFFQERLFQTSDGFEFYASTSAPTYPGITIDYMAFG